MHVQCTHISCDWHQELNILCWVYRRHFNFDLIISRKLHPTLKFIKNWQTKPVQKISPNSITLWNNNFERHYCLGSPLPLPRPRPLPLPRPQPRPRPATASLFLDFTLGSTSTSNVSRGKLSGRIKYRMLFPRILNVSNCTGSLFFSVIFTALRCVFMLTSTPKKENRTITRRQSILPQLK